MKEDIKYMDFVSDVKEIVRIGRNAAYDATRREMLMTYWSIGRRIVEEEQKGSARAEYGTKLISYLSEQLTNEFGPGYSKRNLSDFRKFYCLFPQIEILHTRVQNLSWSHFRFLLRVEDEDARLWYMKEASEQGWSSRTLDRNISTQYYYRMLQAPDKEKVIEDMISGGDRDAESYEIVKNPLVAEFLGFKISDSLMESDLENAIISHIRDFMMEMGRGFAFVARQQHIATEIDDYYIDLVFYNIELRCYVLVDLKIGKITHQDIGQIDMYVRMYDDLKRSEDDNPTIGILLCSETDRDIARYSVLHDNNRLFMSKYLTYLPSEEQLKEEIE